MSELFTDLQPPPHGLAKLRARMDRPPRWRTPFVLAAALGTVLVTIAPPTRRLPERTKTHETLTGRDGTVLLRVHEDRRVAIYLSATSR